MAGYVDNIMLALLSIKEVLENYLNSQGWERKYSILLASDPKMQEIEIVEVAKSRNQIGLPLIVIDTGLTLGRVTELGDEHGQDIVTLAFYVMTTDNVQLITLGNLIRRKIDTFQFNVLDYTTNRKTILGNAEITQVDLVNTSSPNSPRVHERHSAIINANLELNSKSLL